jgi:hypothetical protein
MLPVELLSAYLDDPAGLSDEDRRRVEARLESDPEARRALAELRLIVSELGDLPSMSAPRSYHLDAEMAGAPEPVALQQTAAWYARHSGAVRWATAAAAVIFVFVLGADLVLNGVFSSEPDSMDSALPANEAEISVRQADDDDSAAPGAGEDAAGGAVAPEETAEEAEEEMAGDAAEDEDGEQSSTPAMLPEAMVEADATATAQVASEQALEAATEAEPEPPAITQGASESSDDDDSDTTMIAIDPALDASLDDDDGSDRRTWRVAEISLVVVLGLLITAMIVLPRLAGSSGRRSG